ncbi:hypothetical protein AB0M39_14890 [Streptomyces sp. NPDC051907]|uniref:hypothetical protein n=1 Tax=Streptomyces sp. NPDC051907 TaxID=3155284 RepID=UPI0034222613
MTSVAFLPVKKPARSLVWDGDDLVDVVGGRRRWSADGREHAGAWPLGDHYDRVLVSPSGRFTVVHGERGAKARVLDGTRLVRKVARASYHAEDYDHPIALGALPDGREIMVHCPEEYNVLQIEELETGRRLTAGERAPKDVFHSRPQISPDGRHLLVAGWVWQPYGVVEVFDLQRALADPAVLDGPGVLPWAAGEDAEVVSACWLDADRVAIMTGEYINIDDEEPPHLGPGELGVWSLSQRRFLHRSPVAEQLGMMLARGPAACGTVVSLYGHPRLVDVATGALVAEWPQVNAARREGSYGVTHIPSTTAALHPDGGRLAVAQPDSIAVITLPAG